MSLTDLTASLGDLQQRIAQVVASEQRPLCLHWSDAELLERVLETLQAQQRRIENTDNALTLAISLLR